VYIPETCFNQVFFIADMEKSSLLCVLVLLVASAAAFIIKDCEDCQPQVALLCTEKKKRKFSSYLGN
jgi:hypothetical protein